jgi:hypothetical protein
VLSTCASMGNLPTSLSPYIDTVPAPCLSFSQAGQEHLLNSLGEQELNMYINFSHYMQRVPYIIPASSSLSRTYRLFRWEWEREQEREGGMREG